MKLTIISAVSNDAKVLEYNWELFQRINGDDLEINWIAILNDGTAPNRDKFIVLNRAPYRKITNKSLINKRSFQHGDSINKGFAYIYENDMQQDLVLILDPDFLLYKKQSEIFEHIISNDLDFFGVDYSVEDTRPRAFRNFPICYCMYINTNKIDVSSIDFAPSMKFDDNNEFMDTGYQVGLQFHGSNHRYHALHDIPLSRVKEITKPFCRSISGRIPPEIFYFDDDEKDLFSIHLHSRHNNIRYQEFSDNYLKDD